MKIIPRENIPSLVLPLPIFTTVIIADAISKQGEEFDLVVGLDEKHYQELKKLSLDESDTELQNNTGDKKRFGEGSYREWYKKNRTIFALIHKQTDSLAAIIWMGPKSLGQKSIKFSKKNKNEALEEVEATWHTVSPRSYRGFRGKGLMKNFLQFALQFYMRFFIHIKFWAGMDDRNSAVIKLFSDAGFKVDKENSDLLENWMVMTRV